MTITETEYYMDKAMDWDYASEMKVLDSELRVSLELNEEGKVKVSIEGMSYLGNEGTDRQPNLPVYGVLEDGTHTKRLFDSTALRQIHCVCGDSAYWNAYGEGKGITHFVDAYWFWTA